MAHGVRGLRASMAGWEQLLARTAVSGPQALYCKCRAGGSTSEIFQGPLGAVFEVEASWRNPVWARATVAHSL